MVSLERKRTFIKGSDHFNRVYALALNSDFENKNMELGMFCGEAVILNCDRNDFEKLCLAALNTCLDYEVKLRDVYSLNCFINYNSELFREQAIENMQLAISNNSIGVDKEILSYIKNISKCLNRELKVIKKIKINKKKFGRE